MTSGQCESVHGEGEGVCVGKVRECVGVCVGRVKVEREGRKENRSSVPCSPLSLGAR